MHSASPSVSPASRANGEQSRKKGRNDGGMKRRAKGGPTTGACSSSKKQKSAGDTKARSLAGDPNQTRAEGSLAFSVESSTAADIAAANVLNAFASAALQHVPQAVDKSQASAPLSRVAKTDTAAIGEPRATTTKRPPRTPSTQSSEEEIDVDIVDSQTASGSQTPSVSLSPAAQHVAVPVATLQPYTVALHAPPTYTAGLQGAYAVGQAQAVAFYPPQFGTPIAQPNYGHPIAIHQPFFAFQAQVPSAQLPHTVTHAGVSLNTTQPETTVSPSQTLDVRGSSTPAQPENAGGGSSQNLRQFSAPFRPQLSSPAVSHISHQPQAMKRRSDDVQDRQEQMRLINYHDEDGDTYLHLAVVQGNRSMCQYILDMMKRVKASPDPRNKLQQTPLHLAAITDSARLVEDLIVAGCDINLPDRNGRTATHLCAIHHSRNSLRTLGQADIEEDVLPAKQAAPGTQRLRTEIRDYQGNAPIHLAVLHDDGRIVNILLEIGADIDCRDGTAGRTALHHAVECSRLPLIRYLLDAGANVNATNYSGSSPLHTAAGREHKEVVAILMSHGADATLMNSEGDTPKDLCRNKQIRQLMCK